MADGEIEYTFQISHPILRRKRAKNPVENRFEIISNDPPLGAGGFGSVRAIVGTLVPEAEELTLKKRKKRVVKIQIHKQEPDQPAWQDSLRNEINIARKVGHHIKEPVIISGKLSHTESYTVMERLEKYELIRY